jgi:hypothetical protein
MTRNSAVWWFGIFGPVLSLLSEEFGLVQEAFGAGPVWGSRLKLALMFVGVISAYLRMSPLALSENSKLAGTADSGRVLSITGKTEGLL